jgi:F-type H+-transporting ATPase subunit b
MKYANSMKPANKFVRICLLALLSLGFALALAIHAQAQDQSSHDQSTPDQSSHDQPASEPKKEAAAPAHKGVAQQLVHETREAADEDKDETAQFKQSSAVRLISKWTGLSLTSAYWLCVLLNFAVIAGVILWAGNKFLPGMFRDRSAAIQKAMREAQKASEEARQRLAGIEARLGKLDAEIAAMRDSAEKEGADEEARIRAAAEEDARKIVTSAEQEIAAAAKAARRQLTAYAADLAVALAQKQIHIDAATDQNLLRSFSGQLGTEPDKIGKSKN